MGFSLTIFAIGVATFFTLNDAIIVGGILATVSGIGIVPSGLKILTDKNSDNS